MGISNITTRHDHEGDNDRSCDGLVDRMIGSAYKRVKLVAENLPLVLVVANALKGLTGTEPMIQSRTVMIDGKLGVLGSTNWFALPAGIDPAKIMSVSARVNFAAGSYCFNDDRFFSTTVEDGQLVLVLHSNAPIEFTNASVRWFVICGA